MIDVIILSFAKSEEHRAMTEECLSSLFKSEKENMFNVIVIESAREIKYENVTVIHPNTEFNYNKFANIGVKSGNSEWICACNNDIIFHEGWATELLKHGHSSMSPKCPNNPLQRHLSGVVKGYETSKHISGWCIMLRRHTWTKIGGFDEDFAFWCADDSYREQLLVHGIEHYLVCDSLVTHKGSKTIKTVDRDTNHKLTTEQAKKYNAKYDRNLFNLRQ